MINTYLLLENEEILPAMCTILIESLFSNSVRKQILEVVAPKSSNEKRKSMLVPKL